MHLVITSCTNRKRKPISAGLHFSELPEGDLESVAKSWCTLLGKASAEYEAAEIYGGRSFQDSVRAATESGAKLLIVSAGLGLVEAGQKVPSYGCTTLAASPDSVSKKISGELNS